MEKISRCADFSTQSGKKPRRTERTAGLSKLKQVVDGHRTGQQLIAPPLCCDEFVPAATAQKKAPPERWQGWSQAQPEGRSLGLGELCMR